ncbi:hypothetical protein [Streptomyces paradoxus]|uniref:hypothetical protein n=1 Tax=Streptomyces paradoxus TaxID=66375 RepID=UPI0038188AA1
MDLLLISVAVAVLAGGMDLFHGRAARLHWTGSDRAPAVTYGYSWEPAGRTRARARLGGKVVAGSAGGA